MKKLIAFILTLALLGTLLVSFSGCGLFSPKVENGTEAAKAAADFVTTDVDKDGIYNAFVKLGLI